MYLSISVFCTTERSLSEIQNMKVRMVDSCCDDILI